MFQKTPQGEDVSFKQSYGASGEQARAVQAGLEADIVALSLAPDVDELVDAGLVDAKWKKQSYKGMVTTRSSSSSCATATRRRSRAGTTCCGPASR